MQVVGTTNSPQDKIEQPYKVDTNTRRGNSTTSCLKGEVALVEIEWLIPDHSELM